MLHCAHVALRKPWRAQNSLQTLHLLSVFSGQLVLDDGELGPALFIRRVLIGLLQFVLHASLHRLLQAFVVIDFKHFIPGEERRVRLLQLHDSFAHRFVLLSHLLLLCQKLFLLLLQSLHPVLVLVVQSLKLAELIRHRLCVVSCVLICLLLFWRGRGFPFVSWKNVDKYMIELSTIKRRWWMELWDAQACKITYLRWCRQAENLSFLLS